MKNFIVLHWNYENKFEEKGPIPLYIDPSQVLFVRKSISNSGGTTITFSSGTSVVVIEEVSEVIKKVWGIS